MMFTSAAVVFYLFSAHTVTSTQNKEEKPCEVHVRIESGWICGLLRHAENGVEYASFQGIPYAKQPLGKLRFKELQPADPWDHPLDATQEGPICPQHDEIFGRLMAPHRGMSEACIYGNVYVPAFALPINRYAGHPEWEYRERHLQKSGLRILVYVHGGAFQSGSADSDFYGPEYLVGEGIIIITFNYRLNVFGFLSLNTPQIPGNAGLRDMVSFLRWVQRNAKAFGGDPHDITLMGQSVGATSAHLLSLSRATKGLFKRVILLSGTAKPALTSPRNAKIVATLFLTQLGINSTTDPDYIHNKLSQIPLERILKANSEVQYMTGFISFAPVVETPFPGITRIVDDEPRELIKRGRGNEYALLIQFTTDECEFFRRRLEYFEFTKRIEENPTILLPPEVVFTTLPEVSLALAKKAMRKYFKGRPTLDEYMHNCLDVSFRYPAFKLAQWRSSTKGAPVYLSQFSYKSEAEIIKKAINLDYNGTAHVEDLTYLFKTNSILGEHGSLPFEDDMMKEWMKMFVINFMKCSNPTCTPDGMSAWPAVHRDVLNYQRIAIPGIYSNSGPTREQVDMIRFFDKIEETARGAPLVAGTPEEAAFINTTLVNLSSIRRPPYVLYRYNKYTNTWEGYE